MADAFEMGIPYSEFRHLTPKKLWVLRKGYEQRVKRIDEYIYFAVSNYVEPAIEISVRKGAWGKGDIKYADSPIFSQEEYLQKKREELFRTLEDAKRRFDAAKKCKKDG